MSTRRMYILVFVLGLAMVWLGFLYTYELNLVQPRAAATEQLAVDAPSLAPGTDGTWQAAGVDSSGQQAVTEAGAGFPLVLAGLGVAFVLGGAVSYRHRTYKL